VTKTLIILFVSCGAILHAQNSVCKKWRNGTFATHPAEGKTTIIIRKGNTQTEINGITGTKDELRIRWIDACTYQLRRTGKTAKNKKEHPGLIITVQILESYETHCLVYISSNLPGDIGYYDCQYMAVEAKDKLIAP
jgi:hypothetical protein